MKYLFLPVLILMSYACTERSNSSYESDEQTADSSEEVFEIVEEAARYAGGMDAFYNHIRNEINYPLFARESAIEGRVFVQFVIDTNGYVSESVVVRGIGGGCDEEALRVVKNAGPFTPASQRGKNVRVRKILPIEFKLDKSKSNPDGSPQGVIIVEDLQSVNMKMKVDARFAEGEWSGTVFEEAGEALPGANIVISGTTSGTVSDLDGTFKLKSTEGVELVISFIGFETVRISKKNL